MIKKQLPFFLLALFLFSCSDDDDSFSPPVIAGCGVANVAEDLVWLRQAINERENTTEEERKYCYVYTAQLGEQRVFVLEDCNPFIDKATPLLDCEGTLLNTANNPINFDQLANRVLLWKPDNFACTINF